MKKWVSLIYLLEGEVEEVFIAGEAAKLKRSGAEREVLYHEFIAERKLLHIE